MPAMRSREETATVVFALLIYNTKLLFVAREDPSEEKEKSSDAEELHLDADVVAQQSVREADRQDDEADQLKQASEECAHGSPLTRRFAPPSPRKRGEGPPPVALRPACGGEVPQGGMRGVRGALLLRNRQQIVLEQALRLLHDAAELAVAAVVDERRDLLDFHRLLFRAIDGHERDGQRDAVL